MQYTFFGHSSFLVEINGVRIIFDPFISPNDLAKSIDVQSLRCDYILLSHGHGDHVADVETIARNSDATIVAAYELAAYYGGKNLKFHPMNIGGRWDFGKFEVKTVNAVHSSVLPDGTYSGNPLGFIVKGGGKSFYYSGDTALTLDMQLIGSYNKVDRAFLCMGDNFTMGVDDAIIAAEFIKCNNITAMHFDTFPYIKIDHQKTIQKFESSGKTLLIPEIGKTYEL
jgi:L-ascorbate metabolism protein UlaG (beta-lactamase superfamily)